MDVKLMLGAIAATVATAACVAAGVVVRRRKPKPPASPPPGDTPAPGSQPMPDGPEWDIGDDGAPLWVVGPYRNDAGQIYGMSPRQQRAWAASFGGRLPTAAEFDRIWASADVRVTPHTYPGAIGPLDSLDDDARAAGAKPGDRIAAGKTWILSPPGVSTNYGFFVPASAIDHSGAFPTWRGIKAYPSSTLPATWYVLQSPGTKHNADHVDYSQAGYAVVPG